MQGNVTRRAQSAGVLLSEDGKVKGLRDCSPRGPTRVGVQENRLGEVRLAALSEWQGIPSPGQVQGTMRGKDTDIAHTANLLTGVVAR